MVLRLSHGRGTIELVVKAQVSLTPSEAKRLIAKGISRMPIVETALDSGKILLKGGTTVSAVAEELVGTGMAISGRISQRGAMTSVKGHSSFHLLLLEDGHVKSLDSDLELKDIAMKMGKKDVLITGANALDINRKAAIMVGCPLGSTAGVLPSLTAMGVTTIIAVGWEKLIPCLEEALVVAGRETTDIAMGMTVGLIPLVGTVVTETDAISMLAEVRTTVIGAGGIAGGEGSTTFIIGGKPSQVKKAWEITCSIKGAELSVIPVPETLTECYPKSPACARYENVGGKHIPKHRGCVYRQPNLVTKILSDEDNQC